MKQYDEKEWPIAVMWKGKTHLAVPVLESSTTLSGRFLCGRLSICFQIYTMLSVL